MKETKTIKVSKDTHAKVAKIVAGTDCNIGNFFDDAAKEKIKLIKSAKVKSAKDQEEKKWDQAYSDYLSMTLDGCDPAKTATELGLL